MEILDRILSVELGDENQKAETVIIIYGPNKNVTAQNKDELWQELTKVTEEVGRIISILGV